MQVPDTLDLTDRARLAIGHMTANHDHQTGYPYFYVHVTGPQRLATHNAWDTIDVTSRYVDSLILARQMTGDTRGHDVEERYRQLLLDSLDPDDGLAYRPACPWSVNEAEMFDQSRALTALTTWYLHSRDDEIRRRADAMVEGLWRVAVHIVLRRPGHAYCFFPYAARHRDGWNPATPGEPCCYNGGALILPLVRYAEATGSDRALELARRFLHYIVDESHIFRPDGSFWPREMHLAAGHFHTRSLAMAGVLRYGRLTGEPHHVEWARRAFDWAMTTSGSFGWFPEGVGTEDYYTTKHSETCNITDMVHVAARLAEAGRPEYWVHVERFARNHLMESQWWRQDWIGEPEGSLPPDTPTQTWRDMPARLMGGYAGRTLPAEFVADGVMMGCCCGAGPRALFLAWQHILERTADGLRVNLHLNRLSGEALVLSRLPYEGRVDVHMRSAGPLFIRMPSGTPEGAVRLSVNGAGVPIEAHAGFARVGSAGPGDVVSMAFPVAAVERPEKLLDWSLTPRWRGDTVVAMAPPGKRLPLYERAEMDRDECPFVGRPDDQVRDPAFRW